MEIKGQLDVLLLSALSRRQAHGYGVIEELRERSEGRFDFREGSVYPALHRLERNGLLTSRWTTGTARRRRVYRLTRKGRSALVRERREWLLLARAMARALG